MKPSTTLNSNACASEPSKLWLWSVRCASGLAMIISAYLAWVSLSGERALGCGIESGCGSVLGSRWAYFLGVPVSLGAVAIHALVLACTKVLSSSLRERPWFHAWRLMVFAAVLLLGAGVWFVALQLFAVGSICAYCLAAHALGGVAGVLILKKGASREFEPRAAVARSNVDDSVPGKFLAAGAGGFCAVVLLAIGQIAFPPRSYEVQAMKPVPVAPTNVVSTSEATENIAAASTSRKQLMKLAGGLITLDVADLPRMGNREATNVVVHLFDYSCKHCRALHPMLRKVVEALSNQVAVALLPVPLDMGCNRLVKAPIPDHTNACLYARYGLAVWRVAPGKLAEFDDWIFAPEHPPSPETVRAEAARLVGGAAFEAAAKDPWVERQIALGVSVLESNHRLYQKSRLPQLIAGTNIIAGPITSEQKLYEVFSTYSQ